jgi:hypothetical protein
VITTEGGALTGYGDPEKPPPAKEIVASTVAAQAIPIPILYGKAKVSPKMIEKQAPWKDAAYEFTQPAFPIVFSIGQVNYFAWIGKATVCTVGGTVSSSDTTSGPDVYGIYSWGVTRWRAIPNATGVPYSYYRQSFVGALCEGEAITQDVQAYVWWGSEIRTRPEFAIDITTGPDALSQSIDASFDSSGYQHVALMWLKDGWTGTSNTMPSLAVELAGVTFGANTVNAGLRGVNPADIVNDLLTHSRRGAGWSSSLVATATTDSGASGYRVYCDAAGINMSWLIESQSTALALIKALVDATNADAVWSGGQLKVVPRSDQAIASPVYGSTGYAPSLASVYDLGPDDFLDAGQPVQVQRRSDADCFNAWPVEYIDPTDVVYRQTTVEAPDAADVAIRGAVKRAATTSLPMIFPRSQTAAVLSQLLAQRSLYSRNTYRFRVPWRYVLLEPTDIVTLTEPGIGLSLTPVRITQFEESDDGTITLTAEDYPAGIASAAGYTPQAGDGYRANEPATIQNLPQTVDGVNIGLGLTLGGANLLLASGMDLSPLASLAGIWTGISLGALARETTIINGPGASLKITMTVSADWYVQQSVYGLKAGTQYTLSAWLYVGSITAGAAGDRSISVQIFNGGVQVGFVDETSLSSTHQTGAWVRKLLTFSTPATLTHVVVRLHAPWGVVYWDQVKLEDGDFATQWAPSITEIPDGAITGAMLDATTSSQLALAGSKTAVFYQAAAPSNPTSGYALRTGDLWFSTDTATYCADSACKGHTVDGTGAANVGAYPHRALYWQHQWNGSAWTDGKGVQLVVASEIAAGAIVASKIAADALQTSNYAEDGSGNPTAGAKLDKSGTALKVAAGNLQVGTHLLTSFGTTRAMGRIECVTGSYTINGPTNISSVTRSTSFLAGGALLVAFTNSIRLGNSGSYFDGLVFANVVAEFYSPNFSLHEVGTHGGGSGGNTYWTSVEIGIWDLVARAWVNPTTCSGVVFDLAIMSGYPD